MTTTSTCTPCPCPWWLWRGCCIRTSRLSASSPTTSASHTHGFFCFCHATAFPTKPYKAGPVSSTIIAYNPMSRSLNMTRAVSRPTPLLSRLDTLTCPGSRTNAFNRLHGPQPNPGPISLPQSPRSWRKGPLPPRSNLSLHTYSTRDCDRHSPLGSRLHHHLGRPPTLQTRHNLRIRPWPTALGQTVQSRHLSRNPRAHVGRPKGKEYAHLDHARGPNCPPLPEAASVRYGRRRRPADEGVRRRGARPPSRRSLR